MLAIYIILGIDERPGAKDHRLGVLAERDDNVADRWSPLAI
jgi:hypothetical protein